MARFNGKVLIGSVVIIVVEGSRRRVQVVGLPGKKRRPANVYRGFFLEQEEEPRPHHSGDEFIDFNLLSLNCVDLEGATVEQSQELALA
ncbi:MAG: hypothetical protein WC768_05120 [Patescibacteria group bacterium]|jgi:hypothetical protein